ncbi:acyltransferase family protein [Pseudoroseomonas ludipueritiae]|uniref:Acyltransferase n=1 Tax=Pseudoroseomonas ludipueritiae TaxID=198093 RepID=A0ABR7RCC0_9PROT|nr:acyltransferase [Pseudoroseomonas ludipueritiae]MBC9179313.1 acyltransferase [Pseudoroseomonas ludipueritiae]MCG7361557.1 acyltransferase [Roseomonas sp. ACRSG]
MSGTIAARARHRTQSLDVGRGISALLVVLFHGLLVFRVNGADNPHLLPLDLTDPWLVAQHLLMAVANGPAYVTFFFVLSGTVLALSLDRDPPSHPGAVLGYLAKRGFRLYPLLVFTAAAAALLQIYYFEPRIYPQATSWFNDGYKIDLASLPGEFLANAQGRSATLNGPAWSIKVEILASAVFPALYWLSLTARRALVAAPLLIAAMFLAPGSAEQWHYMNVFLFSFFIGALVPRWGWQVAAWLGQMGRWQRIALLVALVLVFMFSRRLLAPTIFAPPLVVVLETLAAGIGVVMLLHGRDRAFFHAAPMELLARLSFGIYLLHVLVLSVIGHAVMPFVPENLGPAQALGFGLLLTLATLGATVLVAWLLHGVLEYPMQQLGRAISARMARMPAGLFMRSLKARR